MAVTRRNQSGGSSLPGSFKSNDNDACLLCPTSSLKETGKTVSPAKETYFKPEYPVLHPKPTDSMKVNLPRRRPWPDIDDDDPRCWSDGEDNFDNDNKQLADNGT